MEASHGDQFGIHLSTAIGAIAKQESVKTSEIESRLADHVGLSASRIQQFKGGVIPTDTTHIDYFAREGVKRGLMSQQWLIRFLLSASVPELKIKEMVRDLFPQHFDPLPFGRARSNLPPPTYSDFVDRDGPFERAMMGLAAGNSVVLLYGMGGIGKTSLARELANRCVKGELSTKFDALVWISDLSNEARVTIDRVFGEIARVLGYPGLNQQGPEERKEVVDSLLRSNRVLLVMDNFETVQDDRDNIANWLTEELPEPSKALVTCREYLPAFKDHAWQVEMHGMEPNESHRLMQSKLKQLGITHMSPSNEELATLGQVTSGHPLAIEMILGLMKYHMTFDEVMDELDKAHIGQLNDLFASLFDRNWRMLNNEQKSVLFASRLFRDAATRGSLRAVSGVKYDHRIVAALNQLSDLALMDVSNEGSRDEVRYGIHPLLKTYVDVEASNNREIVDDTISRYVAHYVDLVKSWAEGGWVQPADYNAAEKEVNNLEAALELMVSAHQYQQILVIVDAMTTFWNTRGYSELRERHKAHVLAAAESVGDHSARVRTLCSMSRSATRSSDLHRASTLLDDAKKIIADHGVVDVDALCEVNFAEMKLRGAEGDHARAHVLALSNVVMMDEAGNRKRTLYAYDVAEALYHLGRSAESEALLKDLIPQSDKAGYSLRPMKCRLLLARLCIFDGRLEEAEKHLGDAERSAEIYQHRARMAEVSYLRGLLLRRRGMTEKANLLIRKSAEQFKQLGLVRKEREAEAQLGNHQPSLLDLDE